MSKTQRWTFTVNKPDKWRPAWDETAMEYLVWEVEHAPTTGTEHIQGYVRYKKRKTFETVSKLFPRGTHIEVAKGTEAQNRAYCTKEDAAEGAEHGVFDGGAGQQGRRTDLQIIGEKILSGISLKDIAMEYPESYIRYHSGIDKLTKLVKPQPPLQRTIRTTILWGPTGTGKTHRCLTSFPKAYSVSPGDHPWDGYDGQDVIIFDEFRPEFWPITQMNKYLDKWPCELNARYNNKPAAWTKVFIISNIDPSDWWANEPLMLKDAVWRRIGPIYFVDNQETFFDLDPPITSPASPASARAALALHYLAEAPRPPSNSPASSPPRRRQRRPRDTSPSLTQPPSPSTPF